MEFPGVTLSDADATKREVGETGEPERATAGRKGAVHEIKHAEGGEAEHGGGQLVV